MRPRVAADWRAILWVFGLMPLVAFVQLARPSLAGWLLPVSMYLAYCAGVLAHNHNHLPVFSTRWMNRIHSAVLSFFYGYPIFGWIPTHNENHHRYTNGPGDATATWRHPRKNDAWAAFSFFFRSAKWQAPLIQAYLRRVRRLSPRRWAELMASYALVFGGHLLVCGVAVVVHGPKLGLLAYFSALGIPAAGALWGLMFTNYVQHVDCVTGSRWNHSRNFVSPWMNALIFDNGFHTVHHDQPRLHWSRARAAHAAIASNIEPRLNEDSILGYAFKTYISRGAPKSSGHQRKALRWPDHSGDESVSRPCER